MVNPFPLSRARRGGDVTMTTYAHTNLDAMREALAQIDWENA